jgi:hypothetical protein
MTGDSRTILLFVAVLSHAVLMTGCASSKPRPEPLKIERLVILPAVTHESLLPVRSNQPVYSPMTGVVPFLVLSAVEQQRQRKAAELKQAVDSLSFDPVARFNERVFAALDKAGVKYTLTKGSWIDSFNARVSRDFTAVAGDADAVLDLRIAQFGFFESSRAGGFSPLLAVNAHFWSTKSYAQDGKVRSLIAIAAPSVATKTNPGIGTFRYWSDWREDPGNPRWFSTGRELVFPDLAAVVENRQKLIAKFDEVLDAMIARLVMDVRSRVEGSPGNESQPTVVPEPGAARE